MTLVLLVAAFLCYLLAAFKGPLKMQSSIDFIAAGHACLIAYALAGRVPL